MLDHPSHDVHVLAGVLKALDIARIDYPLWDQPALFRCPALPRVVSLLPREPNLVQLLVGPVKGVRAAADVIDAHQLDAVLDAFHVALDAADWVFLGPQPLACPADPHDAALLGHGLQHLVAVGVADGYGRGPAVAVVDGVTARLNGLDGGPVIGVPNIDEQPQLVHALDGVVPEISEPRVLERLPHAASQHV